VNYYGKSSWAEIPSEEFTMGLFIDSDIQYYLQGISKLVVVKFLEFGAYSGKYAKDGVKLNNLISRLILGFIRQGDFLVETIGVSCLIMPRSNYHEFILQFHCSTYFSSPGRKNSMQIPIDKKKFLKKKNSTSSITNFCPTSPRRLGLGFSLRRARCDGCPNFLHCIAPQRQ
jgi:hypothetical protein